MGLKSKILVISGPSGAGKGTLVAEILKRFPELKLSVSDTTRKIRHGDIPGKSYNFLSEKEFKEKIKRGGFLEWACVHGHYYGTPLLFVRRSLEAGRSVILEIDVQGALQVRNKIPEAVLIFIAAPSLEVLRERLVKRKSESEAQLAVRLMNAEREMEMVDKFKYTVVNDEVGRAATELGSIVKKELT